MRTELIYFTLDVLVDREIDCGIDEVIVMWSTWLFIQRMLNILMKIVHCLTDATSTHMGGAVHY